MVSTWIGWVDEFSEIPLTGKVEYRHVGFSQKLDLDTRNSSTLYYSPYTIIHSRWHR
jgi:hypothetical protein